MLNWLFPSKENITKATDPTIVSGVLFIVSYQFLFLLIEKIEI